MTIREEIVKIIYEYYNGGFSNKSNKYQEKAVSIAKKKRIYSFIKNSALKKEMEMLAYHFEQNCRFNGLKLDNLIGSGWSGKVYLFKTQGVSTAIKIIPLNKRFQVKSIMPQKVVKEIEYSRKAGKLGVGPKVYDAYTCCDKNNQCYYVLHTEYIEGISLKEWIKQHKKDNDKTLHTLISNLILAKLQILHMNGIYHNDLHAENIIIQLAPNGNIKGIYIIDYGNVIVNRELIGDKRRSEYKDIRNLIFGNRYVYSDSFKTTNLISYVIGRLEKENLIK